MQNIVNLNVVDLCRMHNNCDQMTVHLLTVNCTISPF